ncbi:unnamed protein product [Peniophora sp. CBMAI 1063]|nr:unnamed protein product [Peniophora sp. CBMAI 1063]
MPAIRTKSREKRAYVENFHLRFTTKAPDRAKTPSDVSSVRSSLLGEDDDEQPGTVKEGQEEYLKQVTLSIGRINVKSLKSHGAIKEYMGFPSITSTSVSWVVDNPPEAFPRTIVPGSVIVTRGKRRKDLWWGVVRAIRKNGDIMIVIMLYLESLGWIKSAIKKGIVHEPKRLLKTIKDLPANTRKDDMLFVTDEETKIPAKNIVAACTEQEFRSRWKFSNTYSLQIKRTKDEKRDYKFHRV